MKISCCMIAKDEQDQLPRCLESLKGWIDEIIIVDTGSTDNTIEIAKSYGAKVYVPENLDSYFKKTRRGKKIRFGKTRNLSISYSSGDWIFIIDCDEEVVSDMSHFKERLEKIPRSVSALVVSLREVSGGCPSTAWLGIRFFRKESGIQYKYDAHNKAVFNGACAATDVMINHYGYSLDPIKMAAKRERTESLLLEDIKDNPKDHRALYYLTQLKIGEKKYEEARDYGERFFYCVPVHPDNFQFYGVMYFFMSWTELHLGEGGKALAWAQKGLEFYPDDLDLNYMVGRIGYQADMKDLLKVHGQRYLDMLPAVRSRGDSRDLSQFENQVNPNSWFNRTVYTADEAAEIGMKKFMEILQ